MPSTRPILRAGVLVTLASLILAACGGSGSAATGPVGPTDAASSDSIAVSGGATGTISKPGGCGKAISDEKSWEVTFATDEPGWMLDAVIEGTLEPGTYQTGFHADGAATILLYEGSGGTSFDSSSGSGSITVDGSGDSGSIDVTVTDTTTGATARAVGGWTCENWD